MFAFAWNQLDESCLVAVVVPDQKQLTNWCNVNEIEGSWEEICKNKTVKKMLLTEITDMGKKAGLKSFEQVKDLHVHPDLFSIDNGLLTPTLKTKRPDCKKLFMPQIESMYRHLA